MLEKKKLDRDRQPALSLACALCALIADGPDELLDRLKNLLIFEEGRVVLRNGLHIAYRDSKGIYTIGYGFNLQDGAAPGVLRRVTAKSTASLMTKTVFLTEDEAQQLLLIAEGVAIRGVRFYFPRFDEFELPRQVVLAAMVYQMGQGNFGKFGRLIYAAKAHDWGTVSQSMQLSQWYRSDSPARARRMVVAVQTNTFPASAKQSDPGHRFTMPGAEPAKESGPKQGAPARFPWPFDNP